MSTTQSQLQELLNRAGDRPYRELVQYHIKKSGARELQKAVLGETELLPPEIREFIVSYIDATNSQLGYNRSFWAEATCRQAFDFIIKVAIVALPISHRIASVDNALEFRNHDIAFQLFQIPTLSFAYSASTQRKQRKFMGIRKGFLG